MTGERAVGEEAISRCELVQLGLVEEPRGWLCAAEALNQVPFEIKRVYWVSGVPAGGKRAHHAHREQQELLVAAEGAFTVHCDDGRVRSEYQLNSPVLRPAAPGDGLASPGRLLEWSSMPSACVGKVRLRRVRPRLRRVPDADRTFVTAVRFLDLASLHAELASELEEAMGRVLRSGWYIRGPEVEAFEDEFARYCDAEEAVGVGSGLEALKLTLLALGVGADDEVIVSAHTSIATWLAITHTGARPVPVEPDADTMQIDPARVEDAIGPRTAAVVPVHLYGMPADLNELSRIAGEHRTAIGRGCIASARGQV